MSPETKSISTGPAAAAIIASGIGVLTLGILTTGAEFSASLKNALNFYNPAGPLSGKTTVSVIVWLASWILLNSIWKNKQYNLGKAFTITMVLIVAGFALTFPPIFDLFAK